jgi:hypothetical protein
MNFSKLLGIGCGGWIACMGTLATTIPASATPTPIVETTCVWIGDNGDLFKQKCKIFGNSSAGSGTVFKIAWADGMKTSVRAKPNASQFTTDESKRKVELHGTFEFSRMDLPRQIHLDGLGIIVVTYQDYSVSRDYESFDK